MIKKFCWILFASVIVIACGKKQTNGVCESLLSKVTTQHFSDTLLFTTTTLFEYDDDRQLTRIIFSNIKTKEIITDSIIYRKGVIQTVYRKSGAVVIQFDTWDIEGDHIKNASGVLAGGRSIDTRLWYNAKGNIDSAMTGGGTYQMAEKYLYDTAANLIEWCSYFNREKIDHFSYLTFDAKRNPYMLVNQIMGLRYAGGADGMPNRDYIFRHNPLKAVRSVVSNDTLTTTYEYNTADFPVKGTLTATDGKKTVTVFEYKPCN